MIHKGFMLLILVFLIACESPNETVLEERLPQEPEVVEEAVEPEIEEQVVSNYVLRYHLTHLDEIRELLVSAGDSLMLTPISLEGHIFAGWFLDAALTVPVDRVGPFESDLDVYPKWELIEPDPIPTYVIEPFDPAREHYHIHHFRNLILPSDPSMFSGVVYLDVVMRYFGRNTTMPFIGTYNAYSYEVTLTNGYVFEFLVEETATKEEADILARDVSYQLGQLPEAIISGLLTFTLFIGDEHGSSGKNTEHWIDRVERIYQSDHEEYLMHHLSHASLDWSQMSPANNNTISIHDNQTIQVQQGQLNKVEWLAAAQQDGYFISQYAADHPAREDVAETAPAYLAARFRPERFDPLLIEFLSNHLTNRFDLLDQLSLNFPNNQTE